MQDLSAVEQGQQTSSSRGSKWKRTQDLPVAAAIAGSRRSAAWCSWRSLQYLLTSAPHTCDTELAAGVGSIRPHAPCTAVFGTANETEMWLEAGSPDGSLDLEERWASTPTCVKPSGPIAR